MVHFGAFLLDWIPAVPIMCCRLNSYTSASTRGHVTDVQRKGTNKAWMSAAVEDLFFSLLRLVPLSHLLPGVLRAVAAVRLPLLPCTHWYTLAVHSTQEQKFSVKTVESASATMCREARARVSINMRVRLRLACATTTNVWR